MEYAKSFVLYSILHELSKTLGAEVTDGWSEQLTPICVDGNMFAVHISDDAFRADFAARYAASVDEVLRKGFDPPLHLEVCGAGALPRRANYGMPVRPETGFCRAFCQSRQCRRVPCRAFVRGRHRQRAALHRRGAWQRKDAFASCSGKAYLGAVT